MASNQTLKGWRYSRRCRVWRYTLERYWDYSKGTVLFVLLNPSTADENHDDPTNRRGQSFARRWGFGGVVFCNLFADRTPYPVELAKSSNPIGPENDKHILNQAKSCDQIVAAWGAYKKLDGRDREVTRMLTAAGHRMKHLGLTKAGHPKHILYLPGDSSLQDYCPEEFES